MKKILDPIHSYIELNKNELKILDHPLMQRLRNIKQLAFSHYVYPSAQHSRFEHSLGVFHLATKISKNLNLNQKDTNNLKIASLLHDIGHGPFSHITESITGINHEIIGTKIIEHTEIKDILKDNNYNIKKINNYITGKGEMAQILNGSIDIDKMDYLARDSYFTGVSYGTINIDMIINSSKIYKNQLTYKEKTKLTIEKLLTTRYFMYPTVYMHHTSLIVEEMIKKAINLAIKDNEIDKYEILYHTDNSILNLLKNSKNNKIKELTKKIIKRDLYKTAYILNSIELGKEIFTKNHQKLNNNKEEIEEEIANKLNIEKEKIILHIPKLPKSKEIETKIITDKNEIYPIKNKSYISNALNNSVWENTSIKVLTTKNKKKITYEIAKKILNKYIY
jgi:uncharacterized protein